MKSILKLFIVIYYKLFKNSNINWYSSISLKDLLKKNISIDNNVVINKNSTINGNIKLEENVSVGSNVILSGKIQIGRYSFISDGNSEIYSECNTIKIGSFCSIARNCFIRTTNHYVNTLSTSPRIFIEFFQDEDFCISRNGDVEIGNDVWIGANVTILAGLKIGNGSVIGAGSIVTKDVIPYSIVAGNPAKLIKMRFDDEKIKNIEDLKWWDWDKDKILENKELFYQGKTI